MFWIVHQSFGPSDRPGCESITTQSCPVWVYGESVTEEHWERWTGGSATCRVPPWRQTDPSVSCFFSISKSSAFLTWIVGHSQAVLIGSMVSSCSRGLPMSGGKAQMRLLTPSQRQQPLTGSHHCAPVAPLNSCFSSAQSAQGVPGGAERALDPCMDFLIGSVVLPTLLSSHWRTSTSLTYNVVVALNLPALKW